MSRKGLVVGAVAVAAGIALYLMFISGSKTSTSGTKQPAVAGGTAGTGRTDPGSRPALPSGTDPGAPAGQGSTGPTGTGTPPGPPPLAGSDGMYGVTITERPRGTGVGGIPGDTYVVSDVEVRDHRGGSGAPLDVPPNVHTPEGPRIASTLTNAIGQQVKAVLWDCAKGTSRDGRGPKPRVDGQIVVAVKTNQLTVQSVVMQPRDVSETVATTIKACSEPKIAVLTASAPDQADITNYGINVSLILP
jgi:hypothetical protein